MSRAIKPIDRFYRLASKVRDERAYDSRHAIADAIESVSRETIKELDDLRDLVKTIVDSAVDCGDAFVEIDSTLIAKASSILKQDKR